MREVREINGASVVSRIAVLEVLLRKARSRLQSAVTQGAHDDDRAMCWAEVTRILADIEKLRNRHRREGV